MSFHPIRVRCRSAFTLIELLVVIGVIALVIGLMFPALRSARRSAQGTECLNNMRSIGQAVEMYCIANKEHYPISSHTSGSLVSNDCWLNNLTHYGISRTCRQCPLDPYAESRLTSYASNEHFEPLTPGIDFNPITGAPLPGGRTRTYERVGLAPRPDVTVYAYEPETAGTIDHLNTHQFQTADDVRAAIAITRHNHAAHFLFLDWHAAPCGWDGLSRTFSPATSPFDPATAQ